MTREEMISRSFKPYMVLILNNKSMYQAEVILVSADFDNEVFTVRPVDTVNYEDDDIQTSISMLSFKKKEKLKIVKK